MADKLITLTLSDRLYEKTKHLVESGLFADFDEVVRAGLRQVLLEAALIEGEVPAYSAPEAYQFYLDRLREQIAVTGGLFPDAASEEVVARLRQTREELYEEKYAAHFRQQ